MALVCIARATSAELKGSVPAQSAAKDLFQPRMPTTRLFCRDVGLGLGSVGVRGQSRDLDGRFSFRRPAGLGNMALGL